MHFAVFVATIALCASCAYAAFCSGKPHENNPNAFPIATDYTFVRSTKNAKLYMAGSGDDAFKVAHVWGASGYEYGLAYGEILKDDIAPLLSTAWSYFESQIVQGLDKLPKWFADIVASKGLAVALDFQNMLVQKHVNPEYYAEMKGIAESAGVEYQQLVRISLIGEITRGRCSMFGAWGKASVGGKTLQLRALDWDTDAGLQDHPVVVVYHPTSSKIGHAFANVGWAGFMGSLTGVSSTQLGISEIGVSFPDDTFGDESMIGNPFVFLLRDVLQYDLTLDNALTRMATTDRTCHLILGVGDGKLGRMNIIQYSHSNVSFMDDTNLRPVADWHPRIENLPYEAMDWNCPSFQSKMHERLVATYGTLTPEVAISDVIALTTTGSLHVAVYDLTDMQMYVSNARASTETTGPFDAYDRQYVKLDLKAMFQEAAPQ